MADTSELSSPALTPTLNSATVTRREILAGVGAGLFCLTGLSNRALAIPEDSAAVAGPLTVLPEDGRSIYFEAIDGAREEILIEICVLEDPQILQHLNAALQRGVAVRAIVDFRKYTHLPSEREHLSRYLTSAGGELHLSNPVFPRSFPKIILVDSALVVYGSACLDQTTFLVYRDFATTCTDPVVVGQLRQLFENDWQYSAAVGQTPAVFNPTSPISSSDLIISPVNSAERMVGFYQSALQTLDVYSEILGNAVLESELVAAVVRGVRVRLISPFRVNGGSPETQNRQVASLSALSALGVNVHVNGRQNPALPYMHARAAIVDGQSAYLGSISLSPDSAVFNREMGLIFRDSLTVEQLQAQFDSDYDSRTQKF